MTAQVNISANKGSHMKMRARVSVLIATKDRRADLLACVRSVLAQDPPPFELVVIDQGAQTNGDALEALLKGADTRLRYEHAGHLSGLTQARNRAVDLAAGELLLFIDDDVVLSPGYLTAICRLFEDDGAGRVGGASGFTINLNETVTRAQRIRSWVFYRGPFAIERDPLDFHQRPGSSPRPARRLHGSNMTFRRSVLDRHRFDEGYAGYGFGEDRDFSVNVSRTHELSWVPQAQLMHLFTRTSRLDRERFCELRILSWRRFYEQCVPKTVYTRLCYGWLTIGFITLLAAGWDMATVRGTARGLLRLLQILRGRARLTEVLGEGWQPDPRISP